MTFDEIQKHRKKFFNNCRTNKLLRGIVDYIWKLEEGDESGLHLHVLIFYTADSCRDVYIAQQLGEYWKDVVTDGIRCSRSTIKPSLTVRPRRLIGYAGKEPRTSAESTSSAKCSNTEAASPSTPSMASRVRSST